MARLFCRNKENHKAFTSYKKDAVELDSIPKEKTRSLDLRKLGIGKDIETSNMENLYMSQKDLKKKIQKMMMRNST
jgi:hypothetical protein